jgi:hypothetical protein
MVLPSKATKKRGYHVLENEQPQIVRTAQKRALVGNIEF